MHGTPVQAIKIRLSWQRRSGKIKSAPYRPEFGFGAVLRSPYRSMTPEMDPKWSAQVPVIDLSPFPDLLKHWSLYTLKTSIIL